MPHANAVRRQPAARQAGLDFRAVLRPTLFFPAGHGEPEEHPTLADLAAAVARLAPKGARFAISPATFTRAGFDTIRGVKIADAAAPEAFAVWAFVQDREPEDVEAALVEAQAAAGRA